MANGLLYLRSLWLSMKTAAVKRIPWLIFRAAAIFFGMIVVHNLSSILGATLNVSIAKKLGMLRFKPWNVGWEAKTLPLCYAAPSSIIRGGLKLKHSRAAPALPSGLTCHVTSSSHKKYFMISDQCDQNGQFFTDIGPFWKVKFHLVLEIWNYETKLVFEQLFIFLWQLQIGTAERNRLNGTEVANALLTQQPRVWFTARPNTEPRAPTTY